MHTFFFKYNIKSYIALLFQYGLTSSAKVGKQKLTLSEFLNNDRIASHAEFRATKQLCYQQMIRKSLFTQTLYPLSSKLRNMCTFSIL